MCGCQIKDAPRNITIATEVRSPNISRSTLRQEAAPLFFLNESVAWVVSAGAIYTTVDGGDHWQLRYRSNDASDTIEILFANTTNGWATINNWSGSHYHLVVKTTDGGRAWREVLNLESPIYRIDFVSDRIGFVRDRWEPIRRTSDGGHTWRELNLSDEAEVSYPFEGLQYLFFLTPKEGWGYGSAIWHTVDGGETWDTVASPQKLNGMLDSACFIDRTHGWIVGKGRQIWRTTDGKTWQRVIDIPASQGPPEEITKQAPNEFNSVSFINSDKGWIAGNDKTILQSTDGGNSWSVIAVLTNSARAIRFLTDTNGWALDTKGQLLHTLDGGQTWNIQPLK